MSLLELDKVCAGYGDVPVLHDVSVSVQEGQLAAIVGSNGAGKTTLLKTISGLIKPTRGKITLMGQVISGLDDFRIVEHGAVQVPEGRQLFGDMTVLENLEMGSYTREAKKDRARMLQEVLALFPVLAERRFQRANTLSGGEQQMLAIGRALMSKPKLLMLDEPSLGLAPMLVDQLFEVIQAVNTRGTTVLMVEQNAQQVLLAADSAYVLENGQVVMQGPGQDLLASPELKSAYLGL